MSKDYKKVLKYLKDNIGNYSETEINYIFKNYDYLEDNKFVPDILRQIYDELGLLDDKDNLYLGFIDIIKEIFNIDSNIVEVGGGVIPSLGKNITLNQKNGTVTVYDPRLINNVDNDKLILKREYFNDKTDISKCDLVIGLMPCQATEVLIRQAGKYNKDFLIGLCEGGHNAFDDYFDDDIWKENIMYLARRTIEENDMGVLMETDLLDYNDPYPVIYNKRK